MIRYTGLDHAMVPALSIMARASFVETFGPLYSDANLAVFLERALSPAALEGERAGGAITFRLAWDGDALVGFVKLRPLALPFPDPAPDAVELGQLYVLSRWHGTGIAQALMDWAIATARDRAASELCLSVYSDNERAKRFYARYGFEDVGRYLFMVGDQADEDRLMRLKL